MLLVSALGYDPVHAYQVIYHKKSAAQASSFVPRGSSILGEKEAEFFYLAECVSALRPAGRTHAAHCWESVHLYDVKVVTARCSMLDSDASWQMKHKVASSNNWSGDVRPTLG